MAPIKQCLLLLLSLAVVPAFTHAYHRANRLYAKRAGNRIARKRTSGGPSQNNQLFFKGAGLPEVTEGTRHGSLVLECRAAGVPSPTIHWLKDGEPIQQGSSPRREEDSWPAHEDHDASLMRLGSTSSRLHLDCLSRRHRGVYQCVAETPTARITQTTRVVVERSADPMAALFADSERCLSRRRPAARRAAAQVYMWSVSRLEYSGATVQLYCRASGSPKPMITWYDNTNTPITGTEPHGMYELKDSGDLVIHDISFSQHMGTFRCEASNSEGEDAHDTFLYPMARQENDFLLGLGLGQ